MDWTHSNAFYVIVNPLCNKQSETVNKNCIQKAQTPRAPLFENKSNGIILTSSTKPLQSTASAAQWSKSSAAEVNSVAGINVAESPSRWSSTAPRVTFQHQAARWYGSTAVRTAIGARVKQGRGMDPGRARGPPEKQAR